MKHLLFFTMLTWAISISAQNEIELNPDGITVPRTTTGAVTSPVEGLLIYDTSSDAYKYYDGSAWNDIGSSFFNAISGGISYEDGNVAIGRNATDATLWIENDGSGDILRIRKDGGTEMRMFNNGAISIGSNWNGVTEPEVVRIAAPKMIVEDSMVVDGMTGIGTRSPSDQLTVRSRLGTNPLRIIHENNTVMRIHDNRAISLGSNWTNPEANAILMNGSKTIVNDILEMQGGNVIMREDGTMSFYDGGAEKITINPDVGGDGRISTDELEIKGGSDLAELFDVHGAPSSIKPGMIVSIADANGNLQLSSSKRDKQVVGIISGANGIKPGMFMGQHGTIADGEHPIAITGRVYVYANTENGKINAGDFLTTSSRAGHAMRVKRMKKSQGAIIGKALTSLEEKEGFVLVLVNLQ